jgi:cell division protein FtsL
MNQIENISKVYSQSSWRKQVQYITIFVLVLVAIALIAYIFLSISAHATAVGRDIQDKRVRIKELDREIESLEARLAIILSSEQMESRARSLGFKEVEEDQVVYIAIPGYVERQPPALAPYTKKQTKAILSVPFEYTETLFDWLKRQIDWISFTVLEVKR